MNLIELQRALRQLRLGGIATVLETRLHQAQAEPMAPIDLISCLVGDELTRRSERLLDRRRKQAAFRDPHKTLDNFDFTFNPKMNRSLVFDLATCAFIGKREDALFLGPEGTGKSHLAQAIGQAAIQQGYRVMYRETIDLSGSAPARMAQAQMDVRAGALSLRPFQVSRWRLRRTRHLWVFNGVLVLRYGLDAPFWGDGSAFWRADRLGARTDIL